MTTEPGVSGQPDSFVLDTDRGFVAQGVTLNAQGQAALAGIYGRLVQEADLKISIEGYGAGDLRTAELQVMAVALDFLRSGLPLSRVVQAEVVTPGLLGSPAKVRIRLIGNKPIPELPLSPAPPKVVSKGPEMPRKSFSTLAIGLGYPDLRLRYSPIPDFAVEAKAAFESDIQVYSARLYWDFWSFGPLALDAGAEGGYARFYGPEILNGDGSFEEAFLGAEYPISARMRLSVDAGPAWVSASAQGYNYRTTDLIINTALYIYLF